jgi:hypothetical protein
VLNQYAIFKHSNLGAVTLLANNHYAFNVFAASKEFGFTQDWWAATIVVTTIAATIALSIYTS